MSKSNYICRACSKGDMQNTAYYTSYAQHLVNLRDEVERVKTNNPILRENRRTMYNEEPRYSTEHNQTAARKIMNHNTAVGVPQGPDEMIASQDTEKVLQKMRIELKRKQTTIDLLMSEKNRLLQKTEESEAMYFRQKAGFLEEIEELKKANNEFHEKYIEQERNLEEIRKLNHHLEDNCSNLKVHTEEIEKELSEEKKIVEILEETKRELQKSLIEATMNLEVKGVIDHQEAIKILKEEILDLHVQLTTAGRIGEHEKVLRSHTAKENDTLIKRHASIEAELAEAKAKLREEQTTRTSLEEIHLKTIVDSSTSKSEIGAHKSEINALKQQLKTGKERILQLSSQISDEQRHKSKEEQKVLHLERRLVQRTEKAEAKELENIQLLSDNAALRDQVLMLRQQVKDREAEIGDLKGKVAEMQVSVEEFVENTRAANRLEGKRWKQLTQLAQSIQTLSKDAVHDKEL